MIQKAQRYIDEVYRPLLKLSEERQEVMNKYFFGLLKEKTEVCPNQELLDKCFMKRNFYGFYYCQIFDNSIAGVYRRSSMDLLMTIAKLDNFLSRPEVQLNDAEFKSYIIFAERDVEADINWDEEL